MVVVRSVPHIVSTVSGMMVPSWLRGPRGDPTRDGQAGRARASAAAPGASRSAPQQGAASPRPCGDLRRGRGFRQGRRGSRRATPHPASARPDRVAAAVLSVAQPGAGRRLHGAHPRRGRPERDRMACRRWARWRGSSLPPPPGQRAPVLRAMPRDPPARRGSSPRT